MLEIKGINFICQFQGAFCFALTWNLRTPPNCLKQSALTLVKVELSMSLLFLPFNANSRSKESLLFLIFTRSIPRSRLILEYNYDWFIIFFTLPAASSMLLSLVELQTVHRGAGLHVVECDIYKAEAQRMHCIIRKYLVDTEYE